MQTSSRKLPFYRVLYIQVIIAILLGILLGHFYPDIGESFKPLGDGFIKIVKMIIAPVIFLTVVTGIAGMNNMNAVGKVAGKSMIYFLTFSTIALVIGLITANIIRPGDGLNISPGSLDSSRVEMYVTQAHSSSLVSFLMNIIPDTIVSPLVNGNILQVLFVSVVFGLALASIGTKGRPVLEFLQQLSEPVFKMVGMLMKLAPIGAFGAIALQ